MAHRGADVKGQFRTGDGQYCFPLTLADQHTRYLLACRGVLSTQPVTAKPILERAFRERDERRATTATQLAIAAGK